MRFSSVLADLAMWLWIGLLQKEAEWQVLLLWVAPSVAGSGDPVPSRADEPEFYL